ncbi:MAG: Na+/H+ antiporter NhaA [Actinomycetia bacterium]|nr:Na+/H+ antiporter NhaA [Actinomycetes bacterium]MCP5035335.1 Na+/H+ antiporter NhaA [Actinomycetes bacterium]
MTHTEQAVEVPIDRIRQPLQRIIHLENLSGIALIVGAVTALILANTPAAESVEHFWHHHLEVKIGAIDLNESLVHWVNDALMTLFFFVAGLEIKRELVTGDLRDPRKAALPAIAAFGGMIVPAGLYFILSDAATRDGWGIPMATDIAFAVGILTLLGNRVPGRLKVFLLTLAIVDDLGAILVIAIFYTTSLNTTALAAAGALLLAMVVLRIMGVWWMPIYVLVGAALWLAVFESGIHATLAGVACGLLAPARPRRPHQTRIDAHPHATIDELKAIVFDTRETKSIVDRLIHGLHPFVALAIVPVFALANTGVAVSLAALGESFTEPVGLAIMAGLVVGKPVGIVVASWVAVRTKIAVLPSGTTFTHVVGVGLLGGIGFTVSLFITDLAFADPAIVDSAKIAVLSASVLASALGASVLVKTKKAIPEAGPITYDELNATQPEAYLAAGGEVDPSTVPGEATTKTAPSAH